MSSGTIWPEFLSKLASAAPAAARGAAPRRHINNINMVPDGIMAAAY